MVNALNFTKGTDAVLEGTLQFINLKKKSSGSEIIIGYSFIF